jgi:hypothetical protein
MVTTVQFTATLRVSPVPYRMIYGALNIFDGTVRVTVRSYGDEKTLNYSSHWSVVQEDEYE